MGSIEEQQLIEDYLAGRLSTKEKIEMENRMAQEPRFKQSVEVHSDVQNFLSNDRLVSFRQQLSDVHTEELENRSGKSNLQILKRDQKFEWRKIATIAAAVLLLLVPGYWLFFHQVATSTNGITEQYLHPYPLPGTFRGDNEDLNTLALEAYDAGRYEEACNYYTDLIEREPQNELHLFAAGLSNLFAGKAEQAKPLFQKILREEYALIEQQTRWYLAMTYIELEDEAQAKEILQTIKRGEYQYEEAQEVMGKL